MPRLISILCLALLLPMSADAARSSNEAELAKIQQEKKRLLKVRKRLESRLGALGRELHTLDLALVEARKSRREVESKITATDKKLAQLRSSKRTLRSDIRQLEGQMIKQANAAYQQTSREPGWMDIFAGVEVSEIPHRKKMLQFAMLAQEKERLTWQAKVVELAKVEKLELIKRDELAALKKERVKREAEVAKRVSEKRQMTSRVRKDVRLSKEREKQLEAQEKALQRLIAGMGEDLLGSDRASRPEPVRKKRGKLAWPLKGKVVASFGSRPVPGRPRLTGVQLMPKSKSGKGKEVKAIAGGQVRYADWFGGYGLMMIVDHGDGLISVYAHNDALYWQMGDWVEAGEVLAQAGSTGWIEDVRLYFEMRDQGKPTNPKKWCRR